MKFIKNSLMGCFCLWQSITLAQSPCFSTPNGISTNPAAPVNTQCNGTMVNTFDWQAQTFPMYAPSEIPGITQVTSPFYNTGNIHLIDLWDQVIKDYTPADGWELIKKGVGTESEGIVYIVLYNKYTSVLRVLADIPRTESDYQYIQVSLNFEGAGLPGTVTGLLSPQKEYAQPLDQNSLNSVKGIAKYPTINTHFFMADFPVEYDVCTCNLNNRTMSVKFDKISTATINLTGRMTAVTRTIAQINGGAGTIPPDFFSSLTPDTQAGALTFKTLNGITSHMSGLAIQKAEYERQYKVYQTLEKILGVASKNGASTLKGIKILEGKNLESVVGATLYTALKVGSMSLTGMDVLGAASGMVNMLGAPIKAKLDAANGQINMLGNVQVTQAEMKLAGTMTANLPLSSGIVFKVPGQASNASNCTSTYPVYNEVLGRMAVLETPEIEVFKEYTETNLQYEDYGYPHQGFWHYVGGAEQYAIRVNKNFKYRLNPAANINTDLTEIYAAIQVKLNYDPATDNIGNPEPVITNMEKIFEADGKAVFQTPLMPLSCLEQMTAKMSHSHDWATGVHLGPLEYRLKLVTNYVFNGTNSLGDVPQALQINTYQPKVNNVTNTDNFPAYYPSNLQISTTHYTQNTTVFAWGSIEIQGNITTAPNVTVTFVAPQIIVQPDALLSNGVLLKQQDAPIACSASQEYPAADLYTYCTGTKYKANAPSRIEEVETETDKENIALKLYPNPTKDNFTIDFQKTFSRTVSLYNLQGILLQENTFNEVNQATIDTKESSSGMYLVKLTDINGNQKTVKLVKIN